MMPRKAILIDAYLAGHSSREAARIAGLRGGSARQILKDAGLSRPVGRPRKVPQGARQANNLPGAVQ